MEANADAQTCAGGEDGELDERRAEMIDQMGELKDLKKSLNSDNRSQAYENFTKNLSSKIRHLDLDNGFLKEWEKNEQNQRVELTSDSTGGVATITIGDQGWFSNPQAKQRAQIQLTLLTMIFILSTLETLWSWRASRLRLMHNPTQIILSRT